MLKQTAKSAPNSPGVYIFKSADGTPIYIGKAKNLRSRLASYFSSDASERVRAMLSHASSLEFIATDSESEALLLESNLIKQYFPKYNIELKDNERYTYILLTEEKFPRMLLVRKDRGGRIKKKGKVFGPFTSCSAYPLVASTLRKIFRLRTCKKLPKKPCLQYHLGYCTAPCANLVSEEEYAKQVEKIKEALSGNKKIEEIIKEMEREMKNASRQLNFEKAITIRNSIRALSSLLEKQKMESRSEVNEDYIAFEIEKGKMHIHLFRQICGVIRDRKKYVLDVLDENGVLSDFLLRFYEAGGIPRRIYVEKEPDGKEALGKYLSEKRGGQVSIITPKKGDKKKLLDLLHKNILIELHGAVPPEVMELQKELSLPSPPRTIECFDISNLYGSNAVGSMVQFVNGKPNKPNYRRFKIRTVEGQDDIACIKEIVFRRYYRLKKENAALPDLILIDGGVAQLNAALSALSGLQLSVPCVSLAKENEEIYSSERREPLRLSRSSPALKLLQHARDEAHRFGISYHRLIRRRA